MSDERFNVVVWLSDGSYEVIERNTDAATAVTMAANITSIAPAAKVMITDEDDYCCFLWEDGKVVFPPREDKP